MNNIVFKLLLKAMYHKSLIICVLVQKATFWSILNLSYVLVKKNEYIVSLGIIDLNFF